MRWCANAKLQLLGSHIKCQISLYYTGQTFNIKAMSPLSSVDTLFNYVKAAFKIKLLTSNECAAQKCNVLCTTLKAAWEENENDVAKNG